jgi:oxidase EvaA
MKKIFETNLIKLRDKIKKYEKSSISNIDHLIKFYKKLNKKETMKSKLCSINSLKDWQIQNGKIFHKSKQFFSVQGVRINSAKREVENWDQLILNQPHGGILAFLVRETKEHGIEFLLCLRSEPGDKNIKFCPSFSATKSNINLAHGGKKTDLTNIILNSKGSSIIAKTIHNEEGARFWRKKNENWLVWLKNPYNNEINKENFVWANIWQIKKLCLENSLINPFVKTILFMI